MRAKIIGVFTVVVLLVGVLSFALMRATLGDVSNSEDSPRAVTAAVTQLELEGLRVERWLATQTSKEQMLEPFLAGTEDARSKNAMEVAGKVNEAAKQQITSPALVVIFDAAGVVLGRNDSALMRGQKLGERYPGLVATIKTGNTGSDVWVSHAHNEQLLASYAPIRNAEGEVVGGIAIGTSFSDQRMAQTVGEGSGTMLIAAVPAGDKFEIVAKSNGVSPELTTALQGEAATSAARQAQEAKGVVDLAGLPENSFGAARRLSGYGDGKRAVLMAVTPALIVGGFGSLFWPALGVFLFGLLLTVVGAHFLDSYISRPVSDLEDGLLAIINGQRDIRFELEHALLGGLVFRINSLLNDLLGVQEDDTDAEGRTSIAPSSSSFREALNVDERIASLSAADVAESQALRAEPEDTYYARICEEYKAAKQGIGDPVDHINVASFRLRIQGSEQGLTAKHGKPYRFKIVVEAGEVVLVAVPLA